jgi:hypothetical protein
VLDGVVISDGDFYAVDGLVQGAVNDVKIIGLNGNNDGLGLSWKTRVSNVFVRTGDDSLKLWGDYVTIANTTVWQNWNGGVVNLGWGTYSTANYALSDGLYVVKTDWVYWPSYDALNWSTKNNANNAVVASLMTPGTTFGGTFPAEFRNIYVQDPPVQLLPLLAGIPVWDNFATSNKHSNCEPRRCPAGRSMILPNLVHVDIGHEQSRRVAHDLRLDHTDSSGCRRARPARLPSRFAGPAAPARES